MGLQQLQLQVLGNMARGPYGEPAVETIGEIDDISDFKNISPRVLVENLNKIINCLQSDEKELVTVDEHIDALTEKADTGYYEVRDCIDSQSVESLPESPPIPQVISVEIHKLLDTEENEIRSNKSTNKDGKKIDKDEELLDVNKYSTVEATTKDILSILKVNSNDQSEADSKTKSPERRVNFKSQAMVKSFREQSTDSYEIVEPLDFENIKDVEDNVLKSKVCPYDDSKNPFLVDVDPSILLIDAETQTDFKDVEDFFQKVQKRCFEIIY